MAGESMGLVLFVAVVLLLWLAERRWHPARRLGGLLGRRVGFSLPLVGLAYLGAVLPVLLVHFVISRPRPEYWHAGFAEGSALLYTVVVAVLVLPVSIYDVVRRQWHGALAVPLSAGIYFVLMALDQALYASGRVDLIE